MPVYFNASPNAVSTLPTEIDCVIVPFVAVTVHEFGRMPVPGVPASVTSAGTIEFERTTWPTIVTVAPMAKQFAFKVCKPNTGMPFGRKNQRIPGAGGFGDVGGSRKVARAHQNPLRSPTPKRSVRSRASRAASSWPLCQPQDSYPRP